jgi:hypothetical protein
MAEIWSERVTDRRAVQHGAATRYIVWRKNAEGNWRMAGATWSRDEAERLTA